MLARQLWLQAAALLLALAACSVRDRLAGPAGCSAGLQACLDALPPGAVLALPPGRTVLTEPLVLRRRVTLMTAGAAAACGLDGAGCAVLALRMAGPGSPTQRAITVAGAGSVLDHLVLEGGKADPARDDGPACRGAGRPTMGALAVTAANVTISGSVVRDAACYSAVVADPGAAGLRFVGNTVLSNGTHDRPAMWADGLTVIDGVDDVIRGNMFRDNTDVQLVLGGCARCTVADNRIEVSDAPAAASFAGLLVHGWPNSSGDYAGTTITGNTVDCGPGRRCGFGIGVGGRAWYASAMSGGLIAGNTVTRAQVGINVDDATGPVAMRDNVVTQSGGPVRSHCGLWFAGAVNVSPASRRFVDATAGVAIAAEAVTDRDFAGCLPGT